MPTLSNTLLALGLVLIASACSQAPEIKDAPAAEFAAEGLHPVNSSGFEAAYVRPGAGLSSFRAVTIAVLELDNIDISSTPVAGTLRRDWQMTAQRKTALQQTWTASMQRFFRDYTLASSADEALRITARLTRVAPGRPSATTIGGAIQPVGSSQDVVEISAEFRLYDQPGGQLLAVIRDRRTMTSVAMSRTGQAGIQSMFNSWAALLHTRISGR